MTTTDEKKKKRQLPPVTLDESYRICTALVRKYFGEYLWTFGNLSRETKLEINAILALAIRAMRLSDIQLDSAARSEELEEVREDLQSNLIDKEHTDQYAALVSTIRKYEIPQQFAWDMLSTSDWCARMERFNSFDEWLVFGCRLGGSAMIACSHVFQTEKPGFEASAMHCGQALHLTYLLGNICCDPRKFVYFMPREDFEELSIDIAQLNLTAPDQSVARLIRRQVSRIEDLFRSGGRLVNYLAHDGRRVMTTVISIGWHQLMNIKRDPTIILREPLHLSGSERFQFRLKHWLGIEGGGVPVLPEKSGTNHH